MGDRSPVADTTPSVPLTASRPRGRPRRLLGRINRQGARPARLKIQVESDSSCQHCSSSRQMRSLTGMAQDRAAPHEREKEEMMPDMRGPSPSGSSTGRSWPCS